MFEIVGVLEVDDGPVIDEEAGLAFAGSAAEFPGILALEGLDFVFEAPGRGLGEGQEIRPTGADVEFVDAVDRSVLVFGVAGIVGGMLDFVTVRGPDLPALQFGKGGQQVVVGTESRQMTGAQVPGEILHEAEAALARKGGKIVPAA